MILEKINKIRKETGHELVNIEIKEIFLKNNDMWIIGEDRVDESAIIGKGGWVVGRLKEELNLNNIHVESYEEFIFKKYKLKLSLNYLNDFLLKTKINKEPLNNLKKLLNDRLKNIYTFDFKNYIENNNFKKSKNVEAIVALSGGVDSSFSLILAEFLGFNPIAITVDPGSIVLPSQFRKNINNLTKELNIKHEFIASDYDAIINDSLLGKMHPCGRCSKKIEEEINNYALTNKIPIIIYGDMLSTANQSIKEYKNIIRLNLPAILLTSKQEIKSLIKNYNIKEIDGFGCPLLYETHKKYPHMKKFSIGRILRETRAQVLESGEALDLIWSFYK